MAAYRLSLLAAHLTDIGMACTVEGNPEREVVGVATLEDARADEISFLSNPKYESALQTTSAGAVIVDQKQETNVDLTILRVAEPYAAMAALMVYIHGYRKHKKVGLHTAAVIDPGAQIGANADIHHNVTIEAGVVIGNDVVIYPGCFIAENCRMGDGCVLYPNVVLYEGSILGNRVTIHAGTIVGEDGLGYAPMGETWVKIPQIGVVEIGDDVEIGPNCAIDRATLGRTVIGSGSKFSDLIAIGHGTKVGKNCLFVAQVGLAGSVTVSDHVTMAGKVGVAGHLTIGKNAQLGAMCGVMKDVPSDCRMAGLPATPIKDALRSFSLVERLPHLYKQIKQLEAQVAYLQKNLKDSSVR